jgi:hypothetical protein
MARGKHPGKTAPGSFAAVHASLDVKTAVAESLGTQQQYGIAVAARLPLTLVAIDVRLQELIDLTEGRRDSICRPLRLLPVTEQRVPGVPVFGLRRAPITRPPFGPLQPGGESLNRHRPAIAFIGLRCKRKQSPS